jgi:hypothetical protein
MLAHRRDAADVCVATIPCRRAPCSCCDSRPAGGRTRSLVAIPFLRCASGGIVSELSGGDTPWPAGRTRVTMQSGYIADRVWGSRFITGGRGCLARAAIASCIFWSWRPLPLATDTPAHHGASFLLGTIRRDQDSAPRNAPRRAHWSPGRLSPLGLGPRRRIAPRGEPRAATTERASPRGRFRHAFHAHALRARCDSVLRT